MRQIVIADTQASNGVFNVTAHLWLDVPGKRIVGNPRPSRLPRVSDDAPWGITPEEEAYFSKGVRIERIVTAGPFAESASVEEVRAALLLQLNAAQAALNASAGASLDIVGVSFDGSTWSA